MRLKRAILLRRFRERMKRRRAILSGSPSHLDVRPELESSDEQKRHGGKRTRRKQTGQGVLGPATSRGDEGDAEDRGWASGDQTSDHEGTSAEGEEEEILQVDFDVFSPTEDDFQGIKALLGTYLDDETWDPGAIADAVIKAGNSMGSVVRTGDEGYVLAFISCLPLISKAKGWPGVVQRFIESRCENATNWEMIWKTLQQEKIGLLLCERVVNLPAQLLPPLYSSLFQELDAKARKGSLADLYGLESLVILSKAYKETTTSKRKQRHTETGQRLEFIKPEDELLVKMATIWFTFPLHSDSCATQQEKGYNIVGLFILVHVGKKVDPFLRHLQELCEDISSVS